MDSASYSSPITKTAYDALQAKLSVINAGYKNVVVPAKHQHIYEYLLNGMILNNNTKTKIDKNDDDDYDGHNNPPLMRMNNNNNNNNISLIKNHRRQQTPLVNAGYACRIHTITSVISNFIRYHHYYLANSNCEIQIVIMGCGLDVIGLWSSSLLLSTTAKLKIIELDILDICVTKKRILQNQNWIIEPESKDDDDGDDAILIGSIRDFHQHTATNTTMEMTTESNTIVNSSSPHKNNSNKYILCPVDLRDIDQVSKVTNKYTSQNVPTLVISELVLAYLIEEEENENNSRRRSSTNTEQEDEGKTIVDNLLTYCSKHLCSCPGSVMTILEPLGPPNYTTTGTVPSSSYMSVLEGYRLKYTQDFEYKLGKGKSKNLNNTNNKNKNNRPSPFTPFATTLKEASSRFIINGWNGDAYATNLHISSSTSSSQPFTETTAATTKHNNNEGFIIIPEIFDEHAALILHLQSYGVVCAFSKNTDELLKRLICRWIYIPTGEIPPMLSPVVANNNNIGNGNGSSSIAYTYIEKRDEVPTRALFYNVYCGLFEQYPAIRKMMDNVMKSDLSMDPTPYDQTKKKQHREGRSSSSSSYTSSVIGERYKSLGGGFIVAIQYDENNTKQKRQIIGCVGIRKCEKSSSTTTTTHDSSSSLEIFRLAVHEQHRRKRIGQNLLLMVAKIAQAKSCKRLVANTLTILDSAKRLYERCGYVYETDTQLGTSLVMRAYMKEL